MIDGVNVEGCLIIPCKVERINMISIQDLYAIKDIIESHFNSCTRGEEAKNLANIIDDEIDKVSNIEDWACFDEKKHRMFSKTRNIF